MSPPVPARPPLPRSVARRRAAGIAILVLLLLAGAGLGGWLASRQPARLIYPGAVPSQVVPAASLGLYGAYETADRLDVVAAWYDRQGLAGPRESLSGQPSAGGSRGGALRIPLPGVEEALLVGRRLNYRATSRGARTIITLWCDPPCYPDDPLWAGVVLVR